MKKMKKMKMKLGALVMIGCGGLLLNSQAVLALESKSDVGIRFEKPAPKHPVKSSLPFISADDDGKMNWDEHGEGQFWLDQANGGNILETIGFVERNPDYTASTTFKPSTITGINGVYLTHVPTFEFGHVRLTPGNAGKEVAANSFSELFYDVHPAVDGNQPVDTILRVSNPFVQVVDQSDNVMSNWSVSVRQDTELSDGETSLTGARIRLYYGYVEKKNASEFNYTYPEKSSMYKTPVPSNWGKNLVSMMHYNKSQAPYKNVAYMEIPVGTSVPIFESHNTVNETTNMSYNTLILSGEKDGRNETAGTWVNSQGESENGAADKELAQGHQASGIQLIIPKDTPVNTNATYTANLTWTLTCGL